MTRTSAFVARSFLAHSGSFATTRTNVEVRSGTISSVQESRSKKRNYQPSFLSASTAGVPTKKRRKASHLIKNSSTMNQSDDMNY